ncbi:MAG: hypothetical protein EOP19_20445 [Hyphomicrobiales bacterium]|nr:MAG: hypothetical protein EOP19_20445 [Hyphomicrobiales bacterium]
MRDLPDGLIALREVLELREVMRLIEKTARWVDPETFRLLPIWYPEHARRSYFYKSDWSEPQLNRNRQSGHEEHKREGNVHANRALTNALGLRSEERPNWSCCHIWGVDDPTYQEANEVVQDRRYFSCVANMVLLPTPLKAFTDTMPEVKAMLRLAARHLYGWHCGHPSMARAVETIERWDQWEAYPSSWKSDAASFPGIAPLDASIRAAARRRVDRIRRDLMSAGPHYPRDEVRAALAYWKVDPETWHAVPAA